MRRKRKNPKWIGSLLLVGAACIFELLAGRGGTIFSDPKAVSDVQTEAASEQISSAAQKTNQIVQEAADELGSLTNEPEQASTEATEETVTESSANGTSETVSTTGVIIPTPGITAEDIPDYSGEDTLVLNNNTPYFTETDLTTDEFELYSQLDSLGRCQTAFANISPKTMPTEKRGDISSVTPTGWHQAKYQEVLQEDSSPYVYNRSHLIAFSLSAEDANPNNLVTATRHCNMAMTTYENMVGDYVKETGNHVAYRVTPVFDGDNLVCDGILMEAESVEDKGDSILYCVYLYNIQPGITIDYATGYTTGTPYEGN